MKPGMDPKAWEGLAVAIVIMLLVGIAGYNLWGLIHR